MTTTETRPATGTPAAAPRKGFSAGRIAAIVIGCVLVMLGVNLLAGGGIMRWAEHRQDADGFYTAGPGRFSTSAYAMTVPALDVAATGPDVMYQNALLGTLRIKAEPVDDADALFVGIGPSDQVAAYLAGVRHDEITEVGVGLFGADYAEHRGGAPTGAPTAQTFWSASAAGPGARSLTWPVESGDWAVVVMNVDGSADVRADVTAGLTIPVIRIAAITSYVTGGLFVLAGVLLIVPAAVRSRRRWTAA